MLLLFVLIFSLLAQYLLLMLFWAPKHGGGFAVLLSILSTFIMQLIVVFLCFAFVKGTNTYALAFGLGFAIVIVTYAIALFSGFIIFPLMLLLLGGHRKYFVTGCPSCNSNVYWGYLSCNKCQHKFTDNEIELLKEKLLANKR